MKGKIGKIIKRKSNGVRQDRRKQVAKIHKLRKFIGYEILQLAKFLQPCKIPTVTQFLLDFAPFSFWLQTYNSEFGLDSSCLSRLNDFGIVSL